MKEGSPPPSDPPAKSRRRLAESSAPPRTILAAPSAEDLLAGVLSLSRDIHLESSEEELLGRFVDTLAGLFSGRALCVRVLDPRSSERARIYLSGGTARAGIDTERISIKRSSAQKTRLKTAVAASARVKLSRRWDSPFQNIAAGFSVPLVAAGELYGVLDVGYPIGIDMCEVDEPLILPIVNHLSVLLRNERLYRETTVLRDYQSKLIEHADALILGVDRAWRVTVCNQALCRLLDEGRDAVIGRDVRDWLSGADRTRLTKLIMLALSGRKTEPVDLTLRTRSGHTVRTVWSVASISGSGPAQAVVAVGQDQTRLRELENQIIHAEKLATLGQLAAGVVHELNNPLTSITVYADYLHDKAARQLADGQAGVTDADVEKLRRIRAGAQRILELAKDLVQYAKPSGEDVRVLSISHVIKQALSFCEHVFEREGAKLIEELASDLAAVAAVPGQLEQVVINLVTNAVHAVGHGGQVAVRSFSADHGHVGIAIADNGPGIPAADRDRIFEPFFTTKADGRGTGLGLSIVKNIVDLHGGEIRIETSDLGGAEIVVLLPAHLDA